MLGGTPITITIASQCTEQIAAPPMCVFDGKEITKAVDDSALATRGNKYFCATPAFDRDGRITFEFRAVLKDGGKLSLFADFYLCEYTIFTRCGTPVLTQSLNACFLFYILATVHEAVK